MKRLSAILLTCILLITALPVSIFASNIKLAFNGDILNSKVSPVMKNGTTFVPLRVIADTLGASTNYSKTSINEYIEIGREEKVIKLAIKAERGYPAVNGEAIDFKTLPMIIKGTTLVPARFVSEQLGLDVNYISSTNTVAISTKDYVPIPGSAVPVEQIIIKIDGKTIIPEVKSFFENGDFYVPPSIAEKFGATVEANYGGCRLTRKDLVIAMGYEADTTKINWRNIPNKAHAIRKPNQTFIPLKFVAETFNCDVQFDASSNTYNITNNGLLMVELTRERYNDISGYVKFMDGTPAKNLEVFFVPVSADGLTDGEGFYRKHNMSPIPSVRTDENGMYIFPEIDTEKISFGGVAMSPGSNHLGGWYGGTPSEVDPDLLNNVPEGQGLPAVRINLKRLTLPTFYIIVNPFKR